MLYVIAASLPVLKPAEFAVFCDRGFGFRNGIGAKSGGIWCILRTEAFVSCVDSGLFFERIGTF